MEDGNNIIRIHNAQIEIIHCYIIPYKNCSFRTFAEKNNFKVSDIGQVQESRTVVPVHLTS